MFDKENRFQNQIWFVRLWRLRWYLLIPWYAFGFFLSNPKTWGGRSGLRIAWGIAKGFVQMKMGWWWTGDEVKKRLGR